MCLNIFQICLDKQELALPGRTLLGFTTHTGLVGMTQCQQHVTAISLETVLLETSASMLFTGRILLFFTLH